MTSSLRVGLTHRVEYTIPESKTVASLFPRVDDFYKMPQVFATGFLVGLIEWVSSSCAHQHLDWPTELTVGTHVDLSHESATLPGSQVVVEVELSEIDGRRLHFDVEARDETSFISRGTHERFIVNRAKFMKNAYEKPSG